MNRLGSGRRREKRDAEPNWSRNASLLRPLLTATRLGPALDIRFPSPSLQFCDVGIIPVSEKRNPVLGRTDQSRSLLPPHSLPLERGLRMGRDGAGLNEGRHPVHLWGSRVG